MKDNNRHHREEKESLLREGLEEVRRILIAISEMEDLDIFVKNLIEEMEGDRKGENGGGRRGRPIINMYPGVPAGCFPVNLVLMPLKRMIMPPYTFELWRHICKWIVQCNKFKERYLIAISDHYPIIDWTPIIYYNNRSIIFKIESYNKKFITIYVGNDICDNLNYSKAYYPYFGVERWLKGLASNSLTVVRLLKPHTSRRIINLHLTPPNNLSTELPF